MKKYLSVMLMLILLSSVCTVARAEDLWSAKRMDSDVLEFMLELNDCHYFDEMYPYQDVMHLTGNQSYADVSSDRVVRIMRYLRTVSPNGKLYNVLGDESLNFYSALGYKDYQSYKDLVNISTVSGSVQQVKLHEYVEYLNDADSRSYAFADSAYTTDGKGHGILQSSTSIVRAYQYSGNVYWIIVPGYTDCSCTDNTLVLFDHGDRVDASIDVDRLLSSYSRHDETNDLRNLDVWKYNIPGYVYTDEQLDSMTDTKLRRMFRLWEKESSLTWNSLYTPYYSNEDVERAKDLFLEYIGSEPEELIQIFDTTDE